MITHEYIKADLSEAISVNLLLSLPVAQILNHCNTLSTYVCLLDLTSFFFIKNGNSI